MKLKKYLIIIILIQLFLISLSANEKPVVENNNIEEILNNEIDPQFCFSFKADKLINLKNTSLMTREDYLRKARGFLFMGITGVIFTSLSIPVSVSLTVLFWYIAPAFAFNNLITLPFFFFFPLYSIGLPLWIIGFYYYMFYNKQKIPDPFISSNDNNEIVIFRFNLMRQGGWIWKIFLILYFYW